MVACHLIMRCIEVFFFVILIRLFPWQLVSVCMGSFIISVATLYMLEGFGYLRMGYLDNDTVLGWCMAETSEWVK